jgi:putative hydrolase of the HAD superfamily
MITHLLFDAGNTLVYVNMELVSSVLARHGAVVRADALWSAEHRVRATMDDPALVGRTDDRGRWVMYFERIVGGCGVADRSILESALEELREIHARSNLWEVVPVSVRRLLDRARGRYRMAVISNSNGTLRAKLERVGLAGYFEAVLDSHEEGVEKPDPRIFRRALERLGARPEESLYVGDFYHIDVVGARAAGMEAVLLDPAGAHADKPVRRIASIEELIGDDGP